MSAFPAAPNWSLIVDRITYSRSMTRGEMAEWYGRDRTVHCETHTDVEVDLEGGRLPEGWEREGEIFYCPLCVAESDNETGEAG